MRYLTRRDLDRFRIFADIKYISKDVIELNYATKEDITKATDKAIDKDAIGKPNGVASLDSTGNVPISQLGNIDNEIFIITDKLPTEAKDNKIYVIPSDTTGENNIYTEYCYINNVWEKLGEFKTEVDLTNTIQYEGDNHFLIPKYINNSSSNVDKIHYGFKIKNSASSKSYVDIGNGSIHSKYYYSAGNLYSNTNIRGGFGVAYYNSADNANIDGYNKQLNSSAISSVIGLSKDSTATINYNSDTIHHWLRNKNHETEITPEYIKINTDDTTGNSLFKVDSDSLYYNGFYVSSDIIEYGDKLRITKKSLETFAKNETTIELDATYYTKSGIHNANFSYTENGIALNGHAYIKIINNDISDLFSIRISGESGITIYDCNNNCSYINPQSISVNDKILIKNSDYDGDGDMQSPLIITEKSFKFTDETDNNIIVNTETGIEITKNSNTITINSTGVALTNGSNNKVLNSAGGTTDISALATKSSIPTKTSQLINDSNYVNTNDLGTTEVFKFTLEDGTVVSKNIRVVK